MRRILGDQMAQAMEMLCSKAADGGELALDVARELRHPLTAALAYVVLLKRLTHNAASQVDTQPFIDVIEQIEQSVARCSEMVHSLRPFTAADLAPVRAEQLGRIIDGAILIVERAPHTHNAIIDMQIDDPGRRVVCDPAQMEQSIANLIINAVEAVPAGVAPEITIRSISDHDQVEMVVEDNGQGLAQVDNEKIFAPFASSKLKGIGLGLTICRSIVEAVGGRVWCEARQEGGTAFHLTLPSAGPRPV